MTPAQAKRAAFLAEARDDLQFELQDRAGVENPDRWKQDGLAKPLPLLDGTAELELDVADGNGNMHTLATLDVSIIQHGLRCMLREVERELTELGVELT